MILSSLSPRRSGIVRRAIANANPSRIKSMMKASSRLSPPAGDQDRSLSRRSNSPPAPQRTSAFLDSPADAARLSYLASLAVDEVEIVLAELQRQFAHLEVPGTGRGDRRHLGRAARQKELLEAFQFLGPYRAFDHLDAALAGEVHQGAPRDAVEDRKSTRLNSSH